MRLLRVLVILLGVALLGLAGYAYFGDMDADPVEIRVPVELDLANPTPGPAAPVTPTSATQAGATEPAQGADGAD